MMKRFTLWNCALSLVATMAVVHTDAAPPVGPEHRVGGFVLGCQAYTFHRFTAFEAIEKTAAAGGTAMTRRSIIAESPRIAE